MSTAQQQQDQDIHTFSNLEISYKLKTNNPNVIQFKNQRLERLRPRHKFSEQLPSNTFSTSFQTNVKVSSSHHKQMSPPQKTEEDVFSSLPPNSYNKHFRNIQTAVENARQNPQPKKFRKSQRKISIGQNKSLHSESIKTRPSNKYIQIEKKNNKGKLEVKHMENWLNDILVEYCYAEKFDSTIHNPALKKLNIDRNSLLSKGVSHEKIDRIYRSLFVYSIGFNNLLVQVSEASDAAAIRKTIWKVYAMLLEYCARGDFETMVGQIERDKLAKIEDLRQQIQNRQKIIDASEETDKLRNMKIYKQIKQLKEENSNLINEKAIIEEDFKQADQAFNEEVGLRLRFEHKINEIHGIHRELGTKHLRLYEDFSAHKIQYQKLLAEKQKETARVQELRLQIVKLEDSLQKYRKQLEYFKTKLQNSEYVIQSQQKKISKYQYDQKRGTSADMQKDREIHMMKFEVANLMGVVQLKDKTIQEQLKQAELLTQENLRMFGIMEEQRAKIEELNRKQFDFQTAGLSLKAKAELLDSKLTLRTRECEEALAKIKTLTARLAVVQGDLTLMTEKNRLLTSDIQNFNTNLEIMKKAKNIMEDELNLLRKRNETIMSMIQSKETVEGQLTTKLNDASEEIMKLKTALSECEAKLKYTEDSFNHEKSILYKKFDKMKSEREELLRVDEQRKKLMEELEIENEKCRKQQFQSRNKLRDEIFERNNLQLKYKQILLVMEDETKYIKELNIAMSHLKEEKEATNRKLKSTEYVLQERTESFKKQVNLLYGQIDKLNKQIANKKNWIHPMYFAEAESTIYQLKNDLLFSKSANQILVKSVQAKEEEMEVRAKEVADRSRAEIQEIQEKNEKIIFTKTKELEMERMRMEKIEEQLLEVSNRLKLYENENKQSKKEIELANMLNEKTSQLKQLITQNQSLQDRNADIGSKLLVADSKLQEKEKAVRAAEENLSQIRAELESVFASSRKYEIEAKSKIEELENANIQLTSELKMLQDINEKNPTPNIQVNNFISGHQQATQHPGQGKAPTHDSSDQHNNNNRPTSNNNTRSNYLQSRDEPGSKRKDMSRKIQGAFNYYNGIK